MKKQVLFIVLMLMPLMASADLVEIDGIRYSLNATKKTAYVSNWEEEWKYYSGDIVIPASVEHEGLMYSVIGIEDCAFWGSTNLISVTISNGVQFIYDHAFYNCSSLKSIYIPSSLTSFSRFDQSAFVGCSSLSSVHIEDLAAWCNISFGDEGKNPLYYAHHLYLNGTEIKDLVIPSTVTEINSWVFYGCSSLTSVTIPNSVTTIGYEAFKNCSGVTSVSIGKNVTSFSTNAFQNCPSLTSITVESGNTVVDSRDNCNAIIETSSNTLVVGCKNTTIPNSVTSIEDYAFYRCSSLTSIAIPNSVKSIGREAFYGCSGLTSMTIGNRVTSIEDYAFSSCNNLTDVFCYAKNVPTTGSKAFYNTNINNGTLHVPSESINKYRTTSPWSGFKSIVSVVPVYKLTYIVDDKEYKSYEYEEGKSITPEPNPTKEGYCFSGWSEIPETMPAHDVTVTGSFLLRPQCATPTITFYPNGKIKVDSTTEGATCVTNISASNAEPLTDGEISLNTPLIVYTITSYATKEGYDDSEVATATFRYEKTAGDVNADGKVNISDVTELVNMILGQ